MAVNGYGTIGKRIASTLLKINDFQLVGVAKYSVDYSALLASKMGIKLFVPAEKVKEFREKGIEPEGTIEELIEEAELIYDASPGKTGVKNKELYVKFKKPAIFQGGEPPEVAEVSYSTLCNYKDALGKRYVRVVSCNTTGLLRVVCSLEEPPRSVFAVIIRRASDPREDIQGPVNSLLIESKRIPSHHAEDAKTVVKELPITTVAIVTPTTLMHVQVLRIELKSRNTREEIMTLLQRSGRVALIDPDVTGIDTTGKLVELARDAGRPRYDIYENIVFSTAIAVEENIVTFVQAIHQEAIVIPENIDVAYAVLNLETDPFRVVEKTNKALGIGTIERLLRLLE